MYVYIYMSIDREVEYWALLFGHSDPEGPHRPAVDSSLPLRDSEAKMRFSKQLKLGPNFFFATVTLFIRPVAKSHVLLSNLTS